MVGQTLAPQHTILPSLRVTRNRLCCWHFSSWWWGKIWRLLMHNLVKILLLCIRNPLQMFFVADNENLNKAIANIHSMPLIGCDSQRLNLTVKNFLEQTEPTLQKINQLMKKLGSRKYSAALRKKDSSTARKAKWYQMVIYISNDSQIF